MFWIPAPRLREDKLRRYDGSGTFYGFISIDGEHLAWLTLNA
uniref:Uncharacterized protein n=1 Tax=uncultured Desulfobacterium sp. TaxID=201089 RepID=E1YMD3_9BACT|nr:unknown protein [uncultured Desulfobacterium sp.]